jgi:hypothetical protein
LKNKNKANGKYSSCHTSAVVLKATSRAGNNFLSDRLLPVGLLSYANVGSLIAVDLSAHALQEEDYLGTVAAYVKLFARCLALNITHPQQYVCHAKRAAAYLKLRLL